MTESLLKSQLEPVARRQRSWRRARALAICWGIFAVLALLLFAARASFGASLSLWVPVLMGGSVLGTLIVWARWHDWQPDYRAIARKIEERHPELHALLLTAIEQKPDPATGQLNFLQQRVVDEALAESRRHEWVDTVSGAQLLGMRAAQMAALALLVFGLSRLHTKSSEYAALGPGGSLSISVTPGDLTLERGSGFVVLAKFAGQVPAEATLVIASATATNAPAKRIPLTRNLSDPVFGGSITEVGSNIIYRVEFGKERSRDFAVNVFDYPALQRSDARIVYPEYTTLPEKRIEETRRVSAVEGSKVDFTLQLNKPVTGARLVGKDKSIIPLTVESNRPLAHLKDFALMTNGTYELQLIDADRRTNKLTAQFVLEALKNRRPELKLVAPRGDQRVSPLEEMNFNGEAWDDFGLRDHGLSYTVSGTNTFTLTFGTNSAPNEKKSIAHLLKLEDLRAQPDQLVSWFLWADDIGPDGKVRRTASDMYFAEVRPFEEIYRESQAQQGENEQSQSQGQGNETQKLAELQKQIINATWKLEREHSGKDASDAYKSDATVVLDSQAQALTQAEAMQERVTDPRFAPLVEAVVKEMEQAAKHLSEARDSTKVLPDALSSEQSAYQALLKLSAREYMVQRNRNQQQAQGQGQQRNQQQLDQLDMKEQDNRYETQRQATPQQNPEQREQLQMLNRLKELAQRQQDMNERIKELQASLQEAKTDEEREDIQRRLKRLREEQQELLADVDEMRQRMERPENQSKMAEARQQLEKTRNEIQKAAEALENQQASQALASGTRAQRELQQLRDDFRKKTAGEFTDEMRQMRSDARQLAEKQQEISKEMEALGDKKQKTLTDSGERKELADQLQQQRSSLTNLLQNMRQVSEKAEAVEPLLSKQLYDTLRKSSQGQTDNSLKTSSELLARSFNNEARQFEQKARGEISDLKDGVEKAAQSVLGDDVESLRLAKRELDALSQQIEDEISRANGQRSQTNGNGRASGQQGNQQQAQAQQGGQMKTNATATSQQFQQSQQAGEGQQQGENGQQQAGQQGQQGQGQRQNSQQGQPGQGQQPGQEQGQQPSQQQGQQGQQGEGQGQQPGQQQQGNQQGQGQGQQGQNGQQPGQQQGQQGQQPEQGQQPGQGQQPSQQQGQQGQQGQGQGQGQGEGQGQQPGQQAQQNQQSQQQQQQQGQGQGQGQAQGQGQGQGQGQNQQQAQQAQQGQGRGQGRRGGQAPRTPGQQQRQQLTETDQQAERTPQGARNAGPGSGGERTRNFNRARFFDSNPTGEQSESGGETPIGPVTGQEYTNWSDRMRDVEEMLDVPELRNEVSRIRQRMRETREDFKRHSKNPQWDLVKTQIGTPLAELRNRVAEELARREKSDSLVPIDRDPVPGKYSDLVRRYYEKLGADEPAR